MTVLCFQTGISGRNVCLIDLPPAFPAQDGDEGRQDPARQVPQHLRPDGPRSGVHPRHRLPFRVGITVQGRRGPVRGPVPPSCRHPGPPDRSLLRRAWSPDAQGWVCLRLQLRRSR